MEQTQWQCQCGMNNSNYMSYCELCNENRPQPSLGDFFNMFNEMNTHSVQERNIMSIMNDFLTENAHSSLLSSIFGPGPGPFTFHHNNANNNFEQQQFEHIVNMLQQNSDVPSKPTSNTVLMRLEIAEVTDEFKDESCSICLSKFEKGEKLTKLTCDHLFHFNDSKNLDKEGNCLATWLKDHNTCPVCRKELPTEGEITTSVSPTAVDESATTGTGYPATVNMLASRLNLDHALVFKTLEELEGNVRNTIDVLENRHRYSDTDIELVSSQTNCNKSQALLALWRNDGDIVYAIKELTE